MNRRAESLLHTIGDIKNKIAALEGYLEYLENEFKKEVNGEVKK